MYDFFSDFFDNFDIIPTSTYVQKKKTVCPVCKHSFDDFRRTGKFGCGNCYDAFRASVGATLKQIHANTVHTGKIPSHCAENLKKKRRYESLKAQLSQAVKNENYEEAARLHKEIKAMENEVK